MPLSYGGSQSDTDQTFFLYEPPRSQGNEGDKTLMACSAGWGTTEAIKDGIKKKMMKVTSAGYHDFKIKDRIDLLGDESPRCPWWWQSCTVPIKKKDNKTVVLCWMQWVLAVTHFAGRTAPSSGQAETLQAPQNLFFDKILFFSKFCKVERNDRY